jgi:hypothetical protein
MPFRSSRLSIASAHAIPTRVLAFNMACCCIWRSCAPHRSTHCAPAKSTPIACAQIALLWCRGRNREDNVRGTARCS